MGKPGKASAGSSRHSFRDESGDGGDTKLHAIVIVPVLSEAGHHQDGSSRSPEARLAEAVGLARAIDLDVVRSHIVPVGKPRPATLIGKGVVDRLAAEVEELDAGLIVVDQPLSPVQQRNLENACKAKVVDRTGLILEIFGERAKTKEGVLQVDLAHLNYQRGRLVRSWTHLERQRGGAGFLGGPGETQIEADRRILQEKIQKLKRELETVRRTRTLHRAKRKKVPYPVVAIVGYTNAGKSTLFNRLTGAGVVAEDMLFATLDPTLRRVSLPHGTTVILSDTVGFISDLPTHLVAAFRATLEEVVEADLILHLRDMSDPDSAAQAQDVERILGELGVEAGDGKRVMEVWNKIDLIDDPQRREDAMQPSCGKSRPNAPIMISALSGEGIGRLLDEIERRISGTLETVRVHLDSGEMHRLDWLYRNGRVLERVDLEDGGVDIVVQMPAARRAEIGGRIVTPPT